MGIKKQKLNLCNEKKSFPPFFMELRGQYMKKGGDTEKGSSVHFLRGGTFPHHPESCSLTKK
jgi:hypothetical protein